MGKICIGDNLQIHCYKHNGKIHRASNEAVVLDIKKDYIVVGNCNVLLSKSDGKTRKLKGMAILYFFKDKWFNVIAQIKNTGISYYCNVATPFIIEEGAIKYIDYDLDLRILPTGEYRILDRLEYKYHKKNMNYSNELDNAVKNGLDELIQLYRSHSKIFDVKENLKYRSKYEELKKKDEIY